jgi:nucleoside-diphosphate-sugar epimerase
LELIVVEKPIGVLGARSFVGERLLPFLIGAGYKVRAFSRQSGRRINTPAAGITWHTPIGSTSPDIAFWICVAPIWVLPEYLPWMKSLGAKRIVALSSTSRFTKTDSSDMAEQHLAQRISFGEQQFVEWAQTHGVNWSILRPTLIYGLGQDKNVSEIARFISRFGFFPLLGAAKGLRQPVHVVDVANACLAALTVPAANRAYTLSGGETLTYREMVERIFIAYGSRPHILRVPLMIFRVILAALRFLPRYRHWSVAMAERMNRDLVFDRSDAERDLGFTPRRFILSSSDLPQ